VIAAGILGFLLAAITTLWRVGWPAPQVHDEFSYLLAADTFAHGRLANPPHPLGVFFESFHVLQQPVYVSKYPPAQGAVLALGQVLTGRPIVGVWISYGFMSAAFAWMLLAWFPRPVAAGGAVVAALYLTAFQSGSWVASYWGGAVAATGGALLFGGLQRVLDGKSASAAGLLALGMGILANSRPYEGLLVSLPPAICLVGWLWSHRAIARQTAVRAGAAAGVVLLLTAVFIGVYDLRITGQAWKLPYQAYDETYGADSPFVWGRTRTATYHHAVIEQYYDSPTQHPQRTLAAWAASLRKKFDSYRGLFLPSFASVLVLFMPAVLRDKKFWLPAASVGLAGLGLLGETWTLGHYAAPLVAPLLILHTAAAQRLALLSLGRVPAGRYLLHGVLACTLVSALVPPFVRAARSSTRPEKWYERRVGIERGLEASGVPHLILVDYGPAHRPNKEWVYNRAEVDASPVVWARSMGADEDARLLQYYPDRAVWALHVTDDDGPFELQPLREPR
jgi:hypothetical protein